MIDVSAALLNPDTCQPFTALRSSGSFGDDGRFTSSRTPVPLYGSAQATDPKTLQQVPEGDRVTGAKTFYSTSPIYETRDGDAEGLSDILIHAGEQYRVLKVWDWSAFGFWKSVAVRISGT